MLYHISLRFWERVEEFKPRIPKGRLDCVGEDATIPRICLSDSLEGCLTGVPWGGYNLINDPPYKAVGFMAIARLYEFDKSKIIEENLLSPKQIKKFVPDSEISREYWVTNQEIIPEKSCVIVLKDFCIEPVVIEHKGTKYRLYKITRPQYKTLKKEEEDLLLEFVNSDDKSSFVGNHKKELLAVLE